jgi:hypothetical membrane protein
MELTKSNDNSRRLTLALGWCGIVSVAFFLLADGLGAFLTPDYSMTTQAISELMETGAPFKHVVDPLLVGYHGLVIPFSLGLHRAIRDHRRNPLGPVLLACAGATGVLLTLFFPCDPGCEPFVSIRGTLHIFMAVPMGFAILFAILAFSRRLRHDPAWDGFVTYSVLTFTTGIAMAVVTVLLAETDFVGLLERALTYTYLQWYAVMGLAVVRSHN